MLPPELRREVLALFNPEWRFSQTAVVCTRAGLERKSLYATVCEYVRDVFGDVSSGRCPFFMKRQLYVPAGNAVGIVTFVYERENGRVGILVTEREPMQRGAVEEQVAAAAAACRSKVAAHIKGVHMHLYPLDRDECTASVQFMF